jgi:hypothetical protein
MCRLQWLPEQHCRFEARNETSANPPYQAGGLVQVAEIAQPDDFAEGGEFS